MKCILAYTAVGLYFGKGLNDKSGYVSGEPVSAVLCSAVVRRR